MKTSLLGKTSTQLSKGFYISHGDSIFCVIEVVLAID